MTEELTVRHLKKKDANRNLAALPDSVMDSLGVDTGDYVALSRDSQRTISRVWAGYPEDEGEKVVRIDGQTRDKINVAVDETVEAEKAEITTADKIVVALPSNLQIQGDVEPVFRERLEGQPIEEGMEMGISLGMGQGAGQNIPLQVIETEPDGPVVVVEKTKIVISEETMDIEDSSTPDINYEDIGGLDNELERVREMIELPMRHSELFKRLGVEPPKGVLLHGPPGTGKTLIAQAVANEVNANFFSISGPEIMSRFYGESEERLREIFDEATNNAPAIIFIDEIDSIAPGRGDASGDVERRVVSQLLSLMDGLEERGDVVVIGATNRVDAVDNALRRGGRFDRELEIGVPDKEGRKEVLEIHTRAMPLSEDVSLDEYAERTYGYVGADISSLTKEAAMTALRRFRPQIDLETDKIDAEVLQALEVTDDDFRTAIKSVEPSAMREVFVEVPDVEWEDVGGLNDTKEKLQETVQWPLDYPGVFDRMKMEATKGVLMYGPPGTGKTLLAKAVANESESNFISIKGPELLNKYIGESERGVREIFSKARENAPTVIFFDEIDALAMQRGSNSGGSGVSERVVSQLLTELDGLENLEEVVVIATSNRPDLIDDALLRPGRLDRHVHVPVPDEDARREIFNVHTVKKGKPISDDVDLDVLAEKTEGYVGADIEAICREASMEATREFIQDVSPEEANEAAENTEITMEHFESAIDEIVPSISEELKEKYDQIEERLEQRGTEDNENQFGRSFQ